MFPEYEQAITKVDSLTKAGISYPLETAIGIEIFFDNRSFTIVPPIPLPPRPQIKIMEIGFLVEEKTKFFPN